ncbi:MAG TPA: hypothetical protein VHZ03_14280 [Trebonia sp.]|jgi:hypothetical protein|nr:hypothetical protein [Trebonia sp.]
MCDAPVIAIVEATHADGRHGRFVLHSCGALIVFGSPSGGGLWAHLNSYSAGDPAGHVTALIATEGWKAA